MRGLILVLPCLAACLSTPTTECGALICPPGTTCVLDLAACFPPEQVDACAGLSDGDACTFGAASGSCSDGVCSTGQCGDGLITAPEQCDRSNLGGQDCLALGFYGGAGLSCTEECALDTSSCIGRCGDDEVNGPEFCDGAPPDVFDCTNFGFDIGLPSCTSLCAPTFGSCAYIGFIGEDALVRTSAVHGSSSDRVYAVGRDGTVFFDGSEWTLIDERAGNEIFVGEAAAWVAVSPSTVLEVALDQSITEMDTGVGFGLSPEMWVADNGEIWIAGTALAHFDGSAWNDRSADVPGALLDIWGAAPGDVYIASAAGVFHWNGVSVLPVPDLPERTTAIAGTAADNVFASVSVGGGVTPGELRHFDGVSWSLHSLLGRGTNPSAELETVGDDIFATSNIFPGVLQYDGSRWLSVPYPPNLTSPFTDLFAASPSDVRLAGTLMARFSGFGIPAEPAQDSILLGAVTAIWADPSGEIVHSTSGLFAPPMTFFGLGVGRWDNVAWSNALSGSYASTISGVRDELYASMAVGVNAVYVFDGAAWQESLTVPGVLYMAGVASTSKTFAVASFADRLELHERSGGQWSMVDTVNSAAGPVAAIDGGVVYSTIDGTVYINDGNSTVMTETGLTLSRFSKMFATSASDIYLPAAAGLLRYDGTAWEPMSFEPHSVFVVSSVHGTGPDDLFAVVTLPNGPALLHYGGVRWSAVELPVVPEAVFATERFIAIAHTIGNTMNAAPEVVVLTRPPR